MLGLLVVVSPLSAAEPQEKIELSLNSIVMFALESNPDLDISRARVKQAEGAVKKAEAALYPKMDFEAGLGREYNSPAAGAAGGESGTNPTGLMGFLARQLLYDGGSTSATIRQQSLSKRSAEVRSEVAAETIITDAFKHYLSIYKFQHQAEESEGFLNRVQDITKTVDDLYTAGAAGKVAVDYVNSRFSAAKIDINKLVSSLNDAQSELEFLTGPLPGLVAVLPEDLRPEARKIDYYFDKALEQNSALRINRYELQSRLERVNAIKNSYYPVIDTTLELKHKYKDGGDIPANQRMRAMVNFKFNIFDGFERDAEKMTAMAQVDEIEATEQKVIKELKRQITQSYNQLLSLRTSIKETDNEIVSNESLQDLNMQNFKLGNVNVIELMEGEERLNAARLKKYDLISEMYYSAYELLVLVGAMDKENFCASC